MEVIPRKRPTLVWLTKSNHGRHERGQDHNSNSRLRGRNNFTHLRRNGAFSDAVIRVEEVEFPVHRNILACCSDYFRALFTDTLQQSQIDDNCCSASKIFSEKSRIKKQKQAPVTKSKCSQLFTKSRFEVIIDEISPSIMNQVLEHAYGGNVALTQENVQQLLTAADRFQASSLAHECCDFLTKQLSIDNCISIYKFASNFYDCTDLKEVASRFILENFESVYQMSPEFEQLTEGELCDFITDDNLNVRHEESIVEAIIRWVSVDPDNREGHIPKLVNCARIGLMLPGHVTDSLEVCFHSTDDLDIQDGVTLKVMTAVVELQRQLILNTDEASFAPRLPKDLMFIVGGSNFGFPLGIMEVFDCRTWRWNYVDPYNFGPRSYHGITCLDKEIYVVGGFDGQMYLSSCCKFCAETDEMTWESVTPMNTKRCYVGVAQVKGVIYAVGGYDGIDRLNSAEKFETKSNQWSFITPMSQKRSDAGVAVLNDKMYVCGGFSGTECLSAMEMYDPDTDQWSPQPRMPQGRSGLGLVANEGFLYAVGGFNGMDSSVRLSTMEYYNPQTRQWTILSPMPHPRSNFAVAILEGTLYAIGGYNGDRTSGVVECYDFDTDSWYQSSRLSQSRSALSVCVMSGLRNTAAILGREDDKFHHGYFQDQQGIAETSV